LLARPVSEANLGEVLDTIRRHTTLVRGAMEGTMLRNDIFNFARMGTHIERADNTARILDVKYHVLLPSLAWVGSRLDNAQWEMVLRSVAGERAFRWLNAGVLEPKGIAEFLILDGRFPRSLAFCYNKLASNMAGLAYGYGETTPRMNCCVRHRRGCRKPASPRSSSSACTIHHRFHQLEPADRRRHRRRLPLHRMKAGGATPCASPSATPPAIASTRPHAMGSSVCGCVRVTAPCKACWTGN
jgi:uncharacterized alpha-E superfamily protein